MTDSGMDRHDHVLAGLMMNLQAVALQQMGKFQNPLTGEVERDLVQARATIDILDMLKAKCRTDTPAELLRALDQAVMDLQLNYMDEMKKDAAAADGPDEAEGAADTAPADGDDGSTDEPIAT